MQDKSVLPVASPVLSPARPGTLPFGCPYVTECTPQRVQGARSPSGKAPRAHGTPFCLTCHCLKMLRAPPAQTREGGVSGQAVWGLWNLPSKEQGTLLNSLSKAREILPGHVSWAVGRESYWNLAFSRMYKLERKIIILWSQGKYAIHLNNRPPLVPNLRCRARDVKEHFVHV